MKLFILGGLVGAFVGGWASAAFNRFLALYRRRRRAPGCSNCGARIIVNGLDHGKIAAAMGAQTYCTNCQTEYMKRYVAMAKKVNQKDES